MQVCGCFSVCFVGTRGVFTYEEEQNPIRTEVFAQTYMHISLPTHKQTQQALINQPTHPLIRVEEGLIANIHHQEHRSTLPHLADSPAGSQHVL